MNNATDILGFDPELLNMTQATEIETYNMIEQCDNLDDYDAIDEWDMSDDYADAVNAASDDDWDMLAIDC